MSELTDIAQRLARRLAEASAEDGISVPAIVDIVSGSGRGEAINCYPGIPCHDCHGLAVFVSLTSPEYKGKHRGHLTFRKAVEMLIRHMQGTCARHTHGAVLIVDSWDPYVVSEWRPNLRKIASDAHMEIYLVGSGTVAPIFV